MTTPDVAQTTPDNPERPQTPCPTSRSYLDDPYLVGGKKFDLRIYALVTSYSPLRVYLYRRGGSCGGQGWARGRPCCLRRG